MSDGLSSLLEAGEPQRLATGFGFTEGPLWHPDGFYYFVDIRRSTLYRLRPGAAAELCERLSAAHINIGYMYCTSSNGAKTLVVIKVPDIKKAIKVLEGAKPSRRELRVSVRRPAANVRK